MNNWHNEAAFVEILINIFDAREYRFRKQPQVVSIKPVDKLQCALVGRRRLVVVHSIDELSRIRNDYRSQRLVQVDILDVVGKFFEVVKEDVKT
jgi:hypothetical protein